MNTFGSTHYYKASLQYDGTGYAGFQWQKDIPSIQNEFNQALKKLVSEKFTTLGASRTDTGVHAMEQVIKISAQKKIEHALILGPLNRYLPHQIRCLEFSPCPSDFRPALDPVSKEYRYFFTNTKTVNPENQRFIANFPLALDFEAMEICSRLLVGVHDFQNFCSAGSNVKSSIREISTCELTLINPHSILSRCELFKISPLLQSCYQLRICGNGFLKQMVRHIVSSLWMVGSGRLSPADFETLMQGPKREKRIWKVAPPYGLFLHEIQYAKK